MVKLVSHKLLIDGGDGQALGVESNQLLLLLVSYINNSKKHQSTDSGTPLEQPQLFVLPEGHHFHCACMWEGNVLDNGHCSSTL